MKDRDDVTRRLRVLAGYLRMRAVNNPEAERWATLITEAQHGKQLAGGLSGWAERNDSNNVEILQAEFDFVEGRRLMRVWTPGVHNAVWNPFGIQFFSEPTRETDQKFHGVVTVASHEDIYVGWDTKNFQVVVYHLVEAE
jgi:hypothetical protein